MMKEAGFGFTVGRLRKAIRREFEENAAALEITGPQFLVMLRLWKGDGILISVLTKEVCSDGGTVTGLLDRLESKGLIRRERSAEDRRAVRIWLTDAGRTLEAPVLEIITQVNEKALGGLSENEKATLFRLLEKVETNLDA